MRHEHVVDLIRQSRDTGDGELTLTVRPNALAGTDETSEEEPPYRYFEQSIKLHRNLIEYLFT